MRRQGPPHVNHDDPSLVPNVPYFDLPAGLMAPLVKVGGDGEDQPSVVDLTDHLKWLLPAFERCQRELLLMILLLRAWLSCDENQPQLDGPDSLACLISTCFIPLEGLNPLFMFRVGVLVLVRTSSHVPIVFYGCDMNIALFLSAGRS